MVLRIHIKLKGQNRTEVMAMRDKVISALNGLDLTVEKMPDETRVHVSPIEK